MTTSTGSIEIDATLTAGHYNCFGTRYAQHTFSRVEKNGTKVWFDCYGGHQSKKGRVFPSELRTPVYWRHQSHTGKYKVGVNLALARGICCGDPFDTRTEYHKTSGGEKPYWAPNGDCSGLVYAISGVCHQMCNRIMMASRKKTKSLINRPPSFEKTYFAYGYWGGTKGSAQKLVQYVERLIRASSEDERKKLRSAIQEHLVLDLKDYLENAYTPESRQPIIEEAMMPFVHAAHESGEDPSITIEEIVELDKATQRIKREADRLLLGGEITNDQYAEAVNRAMRRFFRKVRDKMGADQFDVAFGFDPDTPGAGDIIVAEEMMEREHYRTLGNSLQQLQE